MAKDVDEPEALTAKKEDFSNWYNQVLSVAGIIDKRYDVKGMYVWLNYGYELMLNIKKHWDTLYKEAGIKEFYFPLIVPEAYANQNKKWFEGFRAEAFWVKGLHEDKATHILRPTGEPAMYPMFKLWIRTHTDLPLRIYETVSSFRYETKHTRPMIRDREITMWFEIHTAHATEEDAQKEEQLHQKLYTNIWNHLALPYLRVRKPQWECFPGALGAKEDYTIMPTGKAMENGSINNLGQAYAKAFDITYKDKQGTEQHAWQLCSGNGARYLSAVIAIHGDDKGLVLPPTIAPIHVVIIPIYYKKDKQKVLKSARQIAEQLKKEGVRVHVDTRDDTPGSKYYDWEIKGVPLRIEIGSRDLKNNALTLVRRDTGKKAQIKHKIAVKKIHETLKDIHKHLYTTAHRHFKNSIVHVNTIDDIAKQLDNKKVVTSFWCGSEDCYTKLKTLSDGIDPFGTDLKNISHGKCIVCGKRDKNLLYISNTY